MHRQKIMAALISALNHLENSLQMLAKNNDEKAFANSVWLAAADTEYALFLFSLTHQDELGGSSWKHALTSKQSAEVQPALVEVQDLLKRAKDSIEADDLVGAHEKTWTVRNMLLRVEELLEKKRKSGSAKTTSVATQSP